MINSGNETTEKNQKQRKQSNGYLPVSNKNARYQFEFVFGRK